MAEQDTSRCDEDIYRNGKTVFVGHNVPTEEIEGWVQRVAEESGQPVDWHRYAGKAIVNTTGSVRRVNNAMLDPEISAEYEDAARRADPESRQPQTVKDGMRYGRIVRRATARLEQRNGIR